MRPLTPAHIVLLQKGWQAGSGFMTALLVTCFLSPAEQGYYYAIGSLLSGYVLLDLGLSPLLVQISARMFPGLTIGAGGHVTPLGETRSAFLGLAAWSLRWYGRASLLALLLLPIGYLYFSLATVGLEDIDWQWPWLLAVVAIALSLSAYPALAILEGTGRVSEVYLLRLIHYAIGAVLAWALLANGLGLYSPAMAPVAVATVTFVWLRFRYRDLFAVAERGQGFSWREEVWPLQKRVALTWFSSYTFLNWPTLAVFYFLDAVSAGRLGLSIVVANIVGSLCASSLIAKVPRLTHLVVEGRAAESRCLFGVEFRKAFLMMCAAYAVCLVTLILLKGVPIASRLLVPFDLALLFGVFLMFHSLSMLAVHFRARGREMLAIPMLIATLVSVPISCALAGAYGIVGVIGSFLAAYGLICVPLMARAWRTVDAA